MRGILQRTKANSFKDKSVLRGDWLDSDQESHSGVLKTAGEACTQVYDMGFVFLLLSFNREAIRSKARNLVMESSTVKIPRQASGHVLRRSRRRSSSNKTCLGA